ncbi:MAG: DUF3850 domain-containing protein [Mycobacteriales bacterium]
MSRRPVVTHDVKCWPSSFTEVISGKKTLEVRFNDRDYRQGDVLLLREWAPSIDDLTVGEFTGRTCQRRITHVLLGGVFGVEDGFVALSISPLTAPAAVGGQWCLFYGGPDPDNCAGLDRYDDEGECEHRIRYMTNAGYARQQLYVGEWEVVCRVNPERQRKSGQR